MKATAWIGLWLGMIMLSSCFKEDEAVQPHPVGGEIRDTVAMTATYRYQVYVDLENPEKKHRVARMATDLGFSCAPGEALIRLNTADFMKGADLGEVPFGVSQDTTGLSWGFDCSDGNPDSTVLGGWFRVTPEGDTVSGGHVYVIDRGMDDLGNPLGFIQVIIDRLKEGVWAFRVAPLFGGEVVSVELAKDPEVNYRWFSFDNGGEVVDAEPPADAWDLLFTQYSTLLFTDAGEPYPYLVTGVLINPKGVMVAIDTVISFAGITYEVAQQLVYDDAWDAIGYDWKEYNFEAGSYTVDPFRTYLIRNRNGFLYKLRFTGFYNVFGQKGYPSYEFQRL